MKIGTAPLKSMSYKKEHTTYKDLGLHFLTLSEKYLRLVKNVLEESIRQQNKHIIVEDVKDGEFSWDVYEAETKWSDFNVLIPVLFNFYHGIELLLKGFLTLANNYDLQAHHDAQELLRDFKNHFEGEKELTKTLEKYLNHNFMPALLAKCLTDNNMKIKDLYIFLRYHSDRSFQKIYDYLNLKYNSTDAIPFFNDMVNDINILMRCSVGLYNSCEAGESR